MSEARIAMSRVQFRDTFVMGETADIFVSHLTQFAQTQPEQMASLQEAAFVSLEQAYGFGASAREDRKPFVYQDGIAIIPVHGALLNRFGGAYSFATGYNYIRRMMNAAVDDSDVQLIVFDVDSPGGEAAGCFELAAEIRAARDSKPMISVVDSLSASAGYALASSASKMFATPSSKIGSIGVVRMHMNMKGMMDKMGVEVTFIEAPQDGMKTAGNPFEALSAEAKKEFQESVDKAYDDFVALIVANRGLDDGSVRETKARVFRADEALALRLIDEVKTPSEAVSAFVAELADDSDPSNEEDEDMATPATPAAGAGARTEVPSTPAAPVAAAAPSQDAINSAVAAALTADRQRVSAIKGLPEAAKRPKLADSLALRGMSVEDAKAILGDAAEEASTAAPAAAGAAAVDATNHLDAAMNASAHPNVGAGAEGAAVVPGAEGPSDEDLTAAILKDHSAMVGARYDTPKAS